MYETKDKFKQITKSSLSCVVLIHTSTSAKESKQDFTRSKPMLLSRINNVISHASVTAWRCRLFPQTRLQHVIYGIKSKAAILV